MSYARTIIALLTGIMITYLISTAPANASGFIFHWEPFTIDSRLTLNGDTGKDIFHNNPFIPDSKFSIADDEGDMSLLLTPPERVSSQHSESKSFMDHIKFSVFLDHGIPHYHHPNQPLADYDDKKISDFIEAITELIYENSKSKSLETIGKTIEPQINFHFEF